MTPVWPRALEQPPGFAVLRHSPEDFEVRERLGFEPDGEGEHVFLRLEKRQLNTLDLVQRVAKLSGVPARDVGYSGLKDRNAVTSQWLSVGLAGRTEPEWTELETDGKVTVLSSQRHRKKLKRGVHRANEFVLRLVAVEAQQTELERRLQLIASGGVPNYFGRQRFGRNGSTLAQARQWLLEGGGRIARNRRGLYLSALRSICFNTLLAQRVRDGSWWQPAPGDAVALAGSRSIFQADPEADDLAARAEAGDLHPALPLWGRGEPVASATVHERQAAIVAGEEGVAAFLEAQGLALSYRAARVIPDDFCWRFCDDGTLILEFSLGAGSYATAVVDELVQYDEGDQGSGNKQ
ncbi:MAG: tRNA pseudouridine(13) synthase TruD [Halieaceae bacterium]